MKSIYKFSLITAIFTASVIFGLILINTQQPLTKDEDDEILERIIAQETGGASPVIRLFEELPAPHVPAREGHEMYTIALRQYRANQTTFEDLLAVLQEVLMFQGIPQMSMEPGMFSLYDSGHLSRFNIITQHNTEKTNAFIIMVDVGQGPPYQATPVFEGPVHYIEIIEEFRIIIITLNDGSERTLYWGDIGVY